MKIELNNRIVEFQEESMTIEQLLKAKKFTYQKIIVKVNDLIIEPEDFSKTIIKNEDKVIVLHLLAGG